MIKTSFKRCLSMLLVLTMLMSMFSICGLATGTTTTPYLAFRDADIVEGSDGSNTHVENISNPLRTDVIFPMDSGAPVTFYFVDANGAETRLAAEDLTYDSKMVRLEADDVNPEVMHIGVVGFGQSNISYVTDDGTYSVQVTGVLSNVDCYSDTVASEANYISQFAVTADNKTFYVVPKSGMTLDGITLDSGFAAFASWTLAADGSYATISIDGEFESGVYYGGQASYTDGQSTSTGWFDIYLIDANPGLRYRYANGEMDSSGNIIHTEQKDNRLENEITGEPNNGFPATFYYVDFVNGERVETNLKASDLTISGDGIITISADENNDIISHVHIDGIGEAEITYTDANGASHTMKAEGVLPKVAFSTASTLTKESYITKFTVKNDQKTFYVAAQSGYTIMNLNVSSDFQEIATVEMSADNTYATVTVTGEFDSGRWYSVEPAWSDGNGTSGTMHCQVQLVDGIPGLKYVYANQDMNGVYESEGGFNTSIDIAPNFPMQGYFYFVEGDNKTRVLPSELTVSDTKFNLSEHSLDPNVTIIGSDDFGTGTVSYTAADSTVYTMNIVCDLPDIGFYTTSTATQESYIKSMDGLTVKTGDKFYVVVHNGTLVNASLEGDFENFADIELSQDGTYATITITDSVPADGHYQVSNEWRCDFSGGMGGQGIYLKNGNPHIAIRYPSMEGENLNDSLVSTLTLSPSFTGEVFFYFVKDGVETRLTLDQLKSSDEAIVSLGTPHDFETAVQYTAKNFGTAQLIYTDTDGVEYTLDVVVDLPEFGYYSEPVASQKAFITEYTLTDSGDNTIYFIARNNLKMTGVELDDMFSEFAEMTPSDDGTVATIKITGHPEQAMMFQIHGTFEAQEGPMGPGPGGGFSCGIHLDPELVHTVVIDKAVKATCTEAGLTEGKHCSDCGSVLISQETVPALGHKLKAVAEVTATYTAAGTKAHWVCETCGKIFSDAAGKTEVTAASLVIPQLVKVESGSATVTEDAVAEAVKDSGTNETVSLPLTEADKDVTAAEIPVAALGTVAEAEKALVIETKEAVVTLDSAALNTIVEAAGKIEKVTIVVEKVEEKHLNEKQAEAVKDQEVAGVVSAEIICGDKNVHDFKGGVVTVQIPFTPAEGTKGSDYIIIYVSDDGKIENIYTTFADGHLVADLKHFSEYVIVKKSEMKFADVADGDWYHDAVEFVYQNGLMNGVGDGTKFDPTGTMTRAMLVTVLHRIEGKPEAGEHKFTDLTYDWYEDAVAWAAENGIVKGTSDTTFAPEATVTREQIATILYRYAEYKGMDVSKRGDISGFPDAAKVDSWADKETKWAVGVGLITGKGNGDVICLAPIDSASRAEVATILMRFIQNVVEK